MKVVQPTVLEFRIPADTRYVAIVRRGVRNLAQSVGFNHEAVCDMEVAVSEAVTNSVQHGSPDPTAAGILVKCEASSERVVFEVQDESPLETLPQTNPNKHDLNNERGRGVNIMRILMDEFEDTRTESGIKVRMAKKKEESGEPGRDILPQS